jgi:hypothetical protein
MQNATVPHYNFADRNSQVKANHGQFPAFTESTLTDTGRQATAAIVVRPAKLRSKPCNLTTFFVAGETLRGTFQTRSVSELGHGSPPIRARF